MREEEMQLSDQAVGALMMALQKSLMEQSDIVPVIKGFNLKMQDWEAVASDQAMTIAMMQCEQEPVAWMTINDYGEEEEE